MSSNSVHGEVYSRQHNVLKFDTDRPVHFAGTTVFSTNKTDRQDTTDILLNVALNTIILTLNAVNTDHH